MDVMDSWATVQARVLGEEAPVMLYGTSLTDRGADGVILGEPHAVQKGSDLYVLLNFAEVTRDDRVGRVRVLVCNKALFRKIADFRTKYSNLEGQRVCLSRRCDDRPLAEPFYEIDDLGPIVGHQQLEADLEYTLRKRLYDLPKVGEMLFMK